MNETFFASVKTKTELCRPIIKFTDLNQESFHLALVKKKSKESESYEYIYLNKEQTKYYPQAMNRALILNGNHSSVEIEFIEWIDKTEFLYNNSLKKDSKLVSYILERVLFLVETQDTNYTDEEFYNYLLIDCLADKDLRSYTAEDKQAIVKSIWDDYSTYIGDLNAA